MHSTLVDLLHIFPQLLIERMAGERGDIAKDDKFHAGPRDGYIHAAEVPQEAYLSVLVGSYHRDEDNVSLLTLEAINGIDRDEPAVRFEELTLLDEFP